MPVSAAGFAFMGVIMVIKLRLAALETPPKATYADYVIAAYNGSPMPPPMTGTLMHAVDRAHKGRTGK